MLFKGSVDICNHFHLRVLLYSTQTSTNTHTDTWPQFRSSRWWI